ncbi:MAG: translation initiation factor IF-2 [Prevotella sp.]|nr:translation initiation factor IF-2 [Prevotella sp.]
MAIRLNKVIRELNIGLQTAVEFLQKKSALGEVEENMNFKINDAQYEALVEEFKSDKETKNKAAKIFPKKPKEKKREPESHRAETLLESNRQQVRPLGKIDLDAAGKQALKPATPTVEADKETSQEKPAETPVTTAPPTTSKPAETVAPAKDKEEQQPPVATTQQPAVSQEAPKAETTTTPSTEPKKTVDEEKKVEEVASVKKEETAEKAPVEEKPVESVGAEVTETVETTEQQTPKTEIFTLKSEQDNAPKVNVVGKIDLDSINQSTRPKRKSKEEKRKEREEKGQHGATPATGEKKKRARIGKERIDINAVGNQGGQNNRGGQGGQGGNQGGNNQNSGQGGKNKGKKDKNRKRNQRPIEVNEEDVAKQVKETLARLTSKNQNKKGAKYRKEKREAVQERLQEERAEQKAESKILKLTEFVTVSELATMMNVGANQVIGTCMSIGIMVSINQRLDAETINIVADEFGFKTEYVSAEVQNAITEEEDDENDLVARAPIVTVMGHVDHGKTSLLDHIRNTNVIAGEAGGITQHIGAYNVQLADGRKITFLDTPGHEAFTAMRARGAQVTDIAIIIIAADDSVMPTTKEAIAHAQAANVPMVFAINKIDKPGANPDKIREDLANMNLLVEEWGGKYQSQEISAKKGMGVDDLLEKVLLEAEMLDLKANPNRKATGSIIESSLDKGRGYVSTVLVSNGTLKVGDIVVAGTSYGRIKAMFNERNQRIQSAGPSDPAIILGLNGAPTAGDSFHVMPTEQEARDIANKRLQLQREQGLRTTKKLGLDELSHRFALGEFHELNIIVKGDTDGSIEALSDSFIRLSTEKVQVNVISKAVGQISENDVMLAAASDAIIVGFQVRPSTDARKLAEREGVEINTYSIIYDAIDEVKSTMQGMLDKVKKEIVTAEIEVKQVFKISKVGTVAGGLVTDGKVHNKDKARVVRDGIVVHTASIGALKRYKDDAKEVATGLECGISLVNFNDIQVGDIIETFMEIEVEQKL